MKTQQENSNFLHGRRCLATNSFVSQAAIRTNVRHRNHQHQQQEENGRDWKNKWNANSSFFDNDNKKSVQQWPMSPPVLLSFPTVLFCDNKGQQQHSLEKRKSDSVTFVISEACSADEQQQQQPPYGDERNWIETEGKKRMRRAEHTVVREEQDNGKVLESGKSNVERPLASYKQGTTVWWKQQKSRIQQQPHILGHDPTIAFETALYNEGGAVPLVYSTSVCCVVCQSSPDQSPCPVKDEKNQARRKQTNSILSYFSASPTTWIIGKVPQVLNCREEQNWFPMCTFCDRPACHSCMRTCERCSGSYCTFCSTINYAGKVDRTFCLDCDASLVKSEEKSSDTGNDVCMTDS